MELIALLASPGHRYEGRPADGRLPAPERELVDDVELRAGPGIVGDRCFGQRAHRDASVTLQSAVALEAVAGGAHRAFRGRGGIRTAPLTDGRLRLGTGGAAHRRVSVGRSW